MLFAHFCGTRKPQQQINNNETTYVLKPANLINNRILMLNPPLVFVATLDIRSIRCFHNYNVILFHSPYCFTWQRVRVLFAFLVSADIRT